MDEKLEGHNIMQFEEEIRRQKDQFKNNESFRLENLKEKIVKIEKEYEERLMNENIELEEVCNDKLWKLVELIENERILIHEQFAKEFEENEQILETQFFNKVQVLMIKMQEIEQGHLKNAKKRRKVDTNKLYENVIKGILNNDQYKSMEKKGNLKGEKKKLFDEQIKEKYFKDNTGEEKSINEEKPIFILNEKLLMKKQKDLEELEENLRKSLLEIEETRALSQEEDMARKKILELEEQQRLTVLDRDEKKRKLMWNEVDKILADEVDFQQSLLKRIQKDQSSYKFLLANQMGEINKSACAERAKIQKSLDEERSLLEDTLSEKQKLGKIDQELASKEEKEKFLSNEVEKLEEQVRILRNEDNKLNGMLAEKMDTITKTIEARREKMEAEFEKEKESLDDMIKLEERKKFQDLEEKLKEKEIVFNERLLKESKEISEEENKSRIRLYQLEENIQNENENFNVLKQSHEENLTKLKNEILFLQEKRDLLFQAVQELEARIEKLQKESSNRFKQQMEEIQEQRNNLRNEREDFMRNLDAQNSISLQEQIEKIEMTHKDKWNSLIEEIKIKKNELSRLRDEEKDLRAELKALNEKASLKAKEVEGFNFTEKLFNLEEDATDRKQQLESDMKKQMDDIEKEHREKIQELVKRTEDEFYKLNMLKEQRETVKNEINILNSKKNDLSEQSLKEVRLIKKYDSEENSGNTLSDSSSISNKENESSELRNLKDEEQRMNKTIATLEEETKRWKELLEIEKKAHAEEVGNHAVKLRKVMETIQHEKNKLQKYYDEQVTLINQIKHLEAKCVDIEEKDKERQNDAHQRLESTTGSSSAESKSSSESGTGPSSVESKSSSESGTGPSSVESKSSSDSGLDYKKDMAKLTAFEDESIDETSTSLKTTTSPNTSSSQETQIDTNHREIEKTDTSPEIIDVESLDCTIDSLKTSSLATPISLRNLEKKSDDSVLESFQDKMNDKAATIELIITKDNNKKDSEIGKTAQITDGLGGEHVQLEITHQKRNDLKPFKCLTCNRNFKKESHLRRHLELQTSDRHQKVDLHHSCDICGKKYQDEIKIKKCRLFHQQKGRVW